VNVSRGQKELVSTKVLKNLRYKQALWKTRQIELSVERIRFKILQKMMGFGASTGKANDKAKSKENP
jgi:hypothetical protein